MASRSSSTKIVVEAHFFKGNERCRADPAVFRAVRERAETVYRPMGMKEQYWGETREKPFRIAWILVWPSQEHYTTAHASPASASLAQSLQSISEETPDSFFFPSEVALPEVEGVLRAPATELTHIHLKAHITLEQARGMFLETLGGERPSGTITNAWGFVPGSDEGEGEGEGDCVRALYMAGWETVEAHTTFGENEEDKALEEALTERINNDFSNVNMLHCNMELHS